VTFSIVARDPDTGDLGVAVASKFLAVGSVVPWAEAGVGAIATQALANISFGPDGLASLRGGVSAAGTLATLIAADPGASSRQVGIVDADGGAASLTGDACLPWAGGRTADGVAVQGNILAGPEVVDAMIDRFASAEGLFPDRLLESLLAGDRAGGDRRGRQSAALLVVRADGGYGGGDDRWIDLRVDDHPDPTPELVRLRGIWRVLMERPEPDDLRPIEAPLAGELRDRLRRLGWAPDVAAADEAFRARMRAETSTSPRVGVPREASADWSTDWDAALVGWMGVANLEERAAALGWIDPVVIDLLREATPEPSG
jgi:uncharacterized Ntn-hydrolase superfamily protein